MLINKKTHYTLIKSYQFLNTDIIDLFFQFFIFVKQEYV